MEIILGILFTVLAVTTFFAIQYSKRNKIKPRSGGVFTVKNKNGKFQVIKVLALSKKGFAHYLIYPKELMFRPETLQISVMADKPENTRVELKKFYKLRPKMIGQIKINSREIQRYLRPKAS